MRTLARQPHTSTLPFKIAYTCALLTLCALVIVNALSLKDSPTVQMRTLVSILKRPWYTAELYGNTGMLFAAASLFERTTYSADDNQATAAQSIPVLVYHGIGTNTEGLFTLSQTQFKEHMFALKQAGYETVSLSELEAFARGERALPEKSFMITFDDGRSDAVYAAEPVLAAANYTAAMFIISKFSDESATGGYYVSPKEIVRMHEGPYWEIGAHSHEGHQDYPIDADGTEGHFYSNFLWLPDKNRIETESEFQTRIAQDFETSQNYLERLLNTPIESFAFPFGDFGQNQKDKQSRQEKVKLIESEAENVYALLFYQYRPGEYFSQLYPDDYDSAEDAVHVKRIDVRNTWSSEELLQTLENGAAKPLPYTDTFDEDHGWIAPWGSFSIEDGNFLMRAENEQAGASAVLDGTRHWQNYTVTAHVESPQQTGVVLWIRFQDDNNNAVCNFGPDFMHIEQTVNGEKRVIRGAPGAAGIPEGPFTVSASAAGRTISCAINDETIVETDFLDPQLSRGGIGVKIWDATPEHASIIINQLSVEPVMNEE